MRTNLFTERNGYTYLDIKLKTWKSIMYILWILLIGLILTREVVIHTPLPVLRHTPLAYASWTSDSSYKEPTLNPDESEKDQNIALIKKIWGKDSWTGLNISRCESGYRTKATNLNTNGTIDQGLFQINSVHGMPSMDNAVANTSYAYLMFKEQGTNPWYSSEKCWNAVLGIK